MALKFHIQDATTNAEKVAVRALLRAAFEVRPGVGDAFAHLYDQVLKTPACSRIAVSEGRVIGHALLASRMFALEDGALPGGIVAMVAVEEAFRGQGIGRALIDDVDALARDQGMVLLQVAGDPRLYTKFGFIPSYVEAKAEMVIEKAPCDDALRLATSEDVSMLAELSLAENVIGAVVADEGRWQWVMETEHPKAMLQCNNQLLGVYAQGDACLLLDDVGFVRVCWGEDTLVVYEAGCVRKIDRDRLLKACLVWGYRNGCRLLLAILPPQNRFLVAMSQFGARVKIQEDYELQAKVLDVPRFLMAMSEVFSVRLQSYEGQGRLGLSVGDVFVELVVGEGIRVRQVDRMVNVDWHLVLSEGAMTRVLLGVDTLQDPEGDPVLDGLLACLFPKRGPSFWLSDSL
ncbi:MAG: GNAT family N-acetyltransferase [Candidatus Latescibacteria bacterium]|nr:GNAT family N-acetyltransferase [Candidatus Latescibacterota bacterium]